MDSVKTILARMSRNPKNVRFKDLCKVCDHYFGLPRQRGSSHRIYRTPWLGNPRINIQNYRGKAKAYQVKQVLLAIENMETGDGDKK
ncbi:MAG: toxin HicA [Candidatus Aminicenantes bacterium]|nr:toxin HicA [Candidatus Aminicenantes bacterium]